MKKAEDEREFQKMKQKEIDRLQEEIVSLTKLKDKMHNKVDRYHKFSKFLEQSVEFSDDFQEVRELIDRYETLITNYKDLLEVEKENEEKINEYRRQLNAYLDVCVYTYSRIFRWPNNMILNVL